jgi:hypothetical protein
VRTYGILPRRPLLVGALVSAVVLVAALMFPASGAVASAGAAPLQPAAGQYIPVAPVTALDTRDGTGGVPVAPLAAGSSVTFPVTGIGEVPATGVSDVYVVLNAIGPTANGCLDDFNPDAGDTGICSATFDAGNNDTDSDIVQVSASGYISLANNSSGTVDAAVTVMGYYTDGTDASAGETYVPLPVDQIVATQSGLGAPQAQIPAGGTLTVQVTGLDGVPSDAAGAALYIGAKYGSTTGWVSAYPAGGTPSSLSLLSYVPGQAVHDLYFGALSSSGQLTLQNNGSGPVDLQVAIQGYLVSPTGSETGSSYQDVPQYRLADTRNGTGGVQSTPVQPNQSITFAATGVDNIPTTGVSAVAETIVAVNPTAIGFLSEYAAGTTDPAQPGVNFYTGGNQGNGLTASLVSSVSPTGEQTITNHSTGTVDIAVTVRGYYSEPDTPEGPEIVTATVSGTTATVTWNDPPEDGGAPITSYTVSVSPDNETVTVDGTTQTATLTGLANAATDTYSVTATNAVGNSDPQDYNPSDVTEQDLQDIGVVTDTTTNTETLDTSQSSLTGIQNNGQETASISGTPDTSDVFNPLSTGNLQADCTPHNKGSNVEDLSPWGNNHDETSYSEHWTMYPYAIPNAKHYIASGGNPAWNAYEELVCTHGGADTWHNWEEEFVGIAVVMNGQFAPPFVTESGNGGSTPGLNNYRGGNHKGDVYTVSSTLGFSLSAGNGAASVSGTQTAAQEIAKSVYAYDQGADGLWGKKQFPASLGPYPDTRVNFYWLAEGKSGYTTDWEGNEGQVLYETMQGLNIYVHTVAGITGYCDDKDPMGNCYGQGFGPPPT